MKDFIVIEDKLDPGIANKISFEDFKELLQKSSF